MRRARFVALAFALASTVSAAQAEDFVLVYLNGRVFTLHGGTNVSKGQQVDSSTILQLGPADNAVFVSQAGNVAKLDGPFCGTIADAEPQDRGSGFFAPLIDLFGGSAPSAKHEKC